MSPALTFSLRPQEFSLILMVVKWRRILSNLAVVKKELLGKSWQRCKVHFIRNILAKVPHKEERRFAAHLKQIWLQPDKKSAPQAAMQLVQEYGERFPDAIRCLEEGLKDLLQF